MAKRKIAIIGLGKISQDQHLPVIEASDDFSLAAVVSSRGLGYRDVPSFRTPAEFYSALPEVGIVAVNTPPHARHSKPTISPRSSAPCSGGRACECQNDG